MQNEDEDLDYISKTQLKAEAEAQLRSRQERGGAL